MKSKTKQRIIKSIGLGISILIILFFFYSIFNYANIKESYTSIGEPNYLIIFITAIFLEGFPQLASPTLILTSVILSGSSPHLIIITISIASLIGSLIGYFVGYHYAQEAVDLFMPKKKTKERERIKHFINKYGKIIIAIIAITPIPYFPLIFGSIKLNKRDFIIYGAIVRSLSYILYGYFLYSVLYI